VPIGGASKITRLMHNAGGVLPSVKILSALAALSDLRPDLPYTRKKLRLVVEGCNDYMPPLPPRWVIPIVSDHKASYGVILRVNLGHRPKCKPQTEILHDPDDLLCP
jgi:hypothetical protein